MELHLLIVGSSLALRDFSSAQVRFRLRWDYPNLFSEKPNNYFITAVLAWVK